MKAIDILKKVSSIPTATFFEEKMRDELLSGEIFDTMQEVKVLIERWRTYYNTIRPHSALEYMPPAPETRVVDINLQMA